MGVMDLLRDLIAFFVVYFAAPIFTFLLVYVVGLRDFNRVFDLPAFVTNIFRRFLG